MIPFLSYVHILALILVSVLTSVGCGDVEAPHLELQRQYHVFGIQADPPVARPDDTITLSAYDEHPTLDFLVYSWSICLYSYGVSTDFTCVDDDLLTPLQESAPRVKVDLGPGGLNLRERIRAFTGTPREDGSLRSLEEGIEIWVILNSGDPNTGLKRSVKRIKVIDAPGKTPLAQNPVLAGWVISENDALNPNEPCIVTPHEGELGLERSELIEESRGDVEECVLYANAGIDVKLTVVGSGVDELSARDGYVYSWYTSSGHYATPAITFGENRLGQYKLPSSIGPMELLFTARSPDGGFTIGRQKIFTIPEGSARVNP